MKMQVKCIGTNMNIAQAQIGNIYDAEDKGNSVRIRFDSTSVSVIPKQLFNNLFEIIK